MTQRRLCLREIQIWKETGELTRALHQIKSERVPSGCVCDCECVYVCEYVCVPGQVADLIG